jgi:hypothetical protein
MKFAVTTWPLVAVVIALATQASAEAPSPVSFRRLSARTGELEMPFSAGPRQQTSIVTFDANRDGRKDFAVTERTGAPSVVLFLSEGDTWKRQVLEPDALKPEAGSTFMDVDRDGDLDLIAGSDASGNQVWWWENPAPKFGKRWKRRPIKAGGKEKHHDQIAGDFDGDGKDELVFWNQGAAALVWATVPAHPRATRKPWKLTTIHSYATDGQPQTRLTPPEPGFKGINEHEGIATGDVDGDGRLDIVGGGHWWKVLPGRKVVANPIDPSYTFTRSGLGQLIEGGRPEVVLVVGDGTGPLMMYEWVKGTWTPRVLVPTVNDGHSLSVADVDGDGHQDIFVAEMRIDGRNPRSRMLLLLGDGTGRFRTTVIAEGEDNHESHVVDIDGDRRLDIVGKPYNHDVPGVTVWMNQGPTAAR